jgi:eukaryotic translation initiation factor 2C
MICETFELSYIYARSAGSVSYAPPAYYADRLCTRGRDYLKALFDGTRREPVTVESVLAEFGLWSNPHASGSNPWHKNLDKVMFYM